jgi:hypothetical protein
MMTFQEKSTLAMTGILLLVFGSYFTLVFTVIAASPGRDLALTGLMVGRLSCWSSSPRLPTSCSPLPSGMERQWGG